MLCCGQAKHRVAIKMAGWKTFFHNQWWFRVESNVIQRGIPKFVSRLPKTPQLTSFVPSSIAERIMSSTVVIAFCSLAIVLLSVVAVMLLVYIFCPPAFCWKRPVLDQQPIVDEVESIAATSTATKQTQATASKGGVVIDVDKLQARWTREEDADPSDERAPEIN